PDHGGAATHSGHRGLGRMSELLQFLLSGVTVGAVYALVALGFTIIYNASDVVNFAQGEFVMLGGMITVFAYSAGAPLPLAALVAIAATAALGVAMNKLTIEPARGAPVVSLVIITIGVSIFIRGASQLVFDKQIHTFPAFSGDDPLRLLGATILPQSLWVIGGAVAVFVGLWLFFTRTLLGRAVLATSNNRLAAQLVGINTPFVMTLSFAMSAGIGALAGVLVTPITMTSYDVGLAFALKGFAAAMLGGMGNPKGALVGGFLLGVLEGLTAGYISSQYKDAAAFIVILAVLFFLPQGLFGRKSTDRV
ncbi:MAG: branched-chain amino acid ABC transporter permease, partial [Caulobacteraceae bacterium]|nr:branched-chain amino acid ABC transporter permease [Caulobacteraceae bacterium]